MPSPSVMVRKQIAKNKMPFTQSQRASRRPREMKAKQRNWLLAGLKHLKAPLVLATLVSLIFSVPDLDWTKPSEHVEAFSGCMSVTKAEIAEGRKAIPMDVTLGDNYDLLSSHGFANAVFQICNLKPGSGHTTAPVCSSFVWMSQGTTKRSVHRPMGETRYKSVRDGNILAGRAAVLVLLAAAKYCWTVLEQPSSSVMEHLPVMQQLWSLVPHVKHTMCMGDYGSPTLKRTHLYSSHTAISDLADHQIPRRLRARAMVVHYLAKDGRRRVKGGSDLKRSQAYPAQFGVALSAIRTRHAARIAKHAIRFLRTARTTQNKLNESDRINKLWVNAANLKPVIAYLSQQSR